MRFIESQRQDGDEKPPAFIQFKDVFGEFGLLRNLRRMRTGIFQTMSYLKWAPIFVSETFDFLILNFHT